MVFSEVVRRVLTTGHTAHLVTLNPDGSPQVSLVWVGLVVNRLKPGSGTLLVMLVQFLRRGDLVWEMTLSGSITGYGERADAREGILLSHIPSF